MKSELLLKSRQLKSELLLFEKYLHDSMREAENYSEDGLNRWINAHGTNKSQSTTQWSALLSDLNKLDAKTQTLFMTLQAVVSYDIKTITNSSDFINLFTEKFLSDLQWMNIYLDEFIKNITIMANSLDMEKIGLDEQIAHLTYEEERLHAQADLMVKLKRNIISWHHTVTGIIN